jgi:hypothetical protein
MVLTPKDAVKTFYDTEMDFLIIGNYLIYKWFYENNWLDSWQIYGMET